ncbi:MAG: hypothetical protein HOO88_05950 [Kiritimatiellaceae bacterium]|nr:hypothetical protein [Kiritimatiellaceae bacterium]
MRDLKSTASSYDLPLSIGRIVGYNMGKAIEIVMISTLSIVVMPFYSIDLKVNPAWLGAAIAIPRFLDSILDIAMGWVSDNTKSRWGRRRPWMFLGGLIMGLSFWLTWTPSPSWGETGILVYFFIMNSLFYVGATLYFVPYYALGNELSMDPDVRARVMSNRSLIWGLVTLVTPWAYKLFYCPIFGGNVLEGARTVGLIIGVICVILSIVSVAASRENPAVMKQAYIPLRTALTESLKCRPFWIMMAVATLTMLGFSLVGGFNIFVGTYHIFNGDSAAMAKLWGYIGMTWGISAVVFSIFIKTIIKQIGDKQTLYLSILLLTAGSASSWWAYNPHFPMLAVLTTLLTAPGVIGMQTVTFLWLADICDYDALQAGVRREGVFSAVKSFVFKSLVAIAGGVAGFLLVVAGIDTSLQQQSEQAVSNLRIMFAVLPGVLALSAIYFVHIYPLTKEKMDEIRLRLQAKEAAESGL